MHISETFDPHKLQIYYTALELVLYKTIEQEEVGQTYKMNVKIFFIDGGCM